MSPEHTTTAILDAAERLFAEQGYDATSIREITRHGGVNVAAVNYHFGDKPTLLEAVTTRIVEPLNERRLRLLDLAVATAAPDRPSLESLLDAFIRPDVETLQTLSARGPTVARFIGRVYGDQTPWIQAMAEEQFAPTAGRFLPLLAEASGLAADDLAWRMRRLVAVIVHTFATWPPDGLTDDEADRLVRRTVALCAGMLRAPPLT
ncbi:MAG: TetR/AcrR family transcriptional regulator [Actinomycetota bacterium]